MRTPSDQQTLFQIRGIPPLGSAVSLSLQHLVAMIVGCVTPPIIIAGAIGLSQADRVLLIQASLVMSAVSTLLQLFPIGGRFGSGLPVILGVSFAYLPSMQAIAASGGGVSAIGGMVYIMTIAGCVWNHEGLSGEGWLAVALVIFCMWRPLAAVWGSVLFGALMILYLRLALPFVPTQLYKILPYVVTVIVLIVSSMRNNREKQPPASLGLSYFREDR